MVVDYILIGLLVIVIILLKNKIIDYNKLLLISMSICFIFACIDEYHQTFIPGRTGQFSDVLIDMIGVIFGCLLFNIYKRSIKREV
jgi:VanZ family protein